MSSCMSRSSQVSIKTTEDCRNPPQVVSGDCLVVHDTAAGTERRVFLSSIRAPRIGRREEKSEPYAAEAKEFLRNRLIGEAALQWCAWRQMDRVCIASRSGHHLMRSHTHAHCCLAWY
jgi:endonuclease YncB( thermonuclease family)